MEISGTENATACHLSQPQILWHLNLKCGTVLGGFHVPICAYMFLNKFSYILQLQEDVVNYTRFQMVGGRLLLKKGVVPHKFQCQGKHQIKRRAAASKRDQYRNLQDALAVSSDQEVK